MTNIKFLSISMILWPLLASAQSEFLYNRDGFSFANYGNQDNPLNLTPGQIERLCGHIACAHGTGNNCSLRAPARSLMQRYNNIMNGGHCEGMSAVAEGRFTNKIPAQWLDSNAKSTFSLKRTPRVLSEIAYWFSTQFTSPTHPSKRQNLLPNQVLSILRNPQGETYSMQMFNPKKPGASVNTGHTVTPFMVIDDPKQKKARIAIYDSNFPNQTRLINVDTARNEWNYPGFPAMKPERKIMILVPLSARLKQQNCPELGFAQAPQPAKPQPVKPQKPQPAKPHPNVWPKGTEPEWVEEDEWEEEEWVDYEQPQQKKWNLQVDNDGVKFDFGDVIDLIEAFIGGGVDEIRIPDTAASSIYQVEPGKDRRFHLVANNLKTKSATNFYVTSRGQAMSIEGIMPHQGQSDDVFVGKDGETLSYSTNFAEPITMGLAESLADGDFDIKIKPTAKAGGFDLRINNIIEQRYGFHELEVELVNHDKSPASYTIEMTRIGPVSDEKFTHREARDLTVSPGELDRIEYGQWHNNQDALNVVDVVPGKAEKSIELSDDQ